MDSVNGFRTTLGIYCLQLTGGWFFEEAMRQLGNEVCVRQSSSRLDVVEICRAQNQAEDQPCQR
jgi:hypothetical protein